MRPRPFGASRFPLLLSLFIYLLRKKEKEKGGVNSREWRRSECAGSVKPFEKRQALVSPSGPATSPAGHGSGAEIRWPRGGDGPGVAFTPFCKRSVNL